MSCTGLWAKKQSTMLSPDAAQRKAIRFFEQKTADGYDMSSWTILRSHPTKLSPANLVLLAAATDEDIGTLISSGIGLDNRLSDFEPHVIIDRRGIRPRHNTYEFD
jgi:hypothetical protein